MVRFGVMVYRETGRQVNTDLIDADAAEIYSVRCDWYLFIRSFIMTFTKSGYSYLHGPLPL